MATDRETIKTWFETGDTPTEAQFAEALDSYVHQDDLSDVAKESSEKNIENKVLDNNSKLVAIAQELNKIGSPAEGQPSTLFEAIAEGGGGGGAQFYQYPVQQMTATTATLQPNVLYIWGEVSALTITLATPTDNTIVNEYMMQFYSGDVAATLTFTDGTISVRGRIDTNSLVSVSVLNKEALIG